MQTRHLLHIVDPSSRIRAEIASLAFSLGHHAEVYADFDELSERRLDAGIILVRDDPALGGVASFMESLSRSGIWLPVVALADRVEPDAIVDAMKAGALDYLALPLSADQLDRTLGRIGAEAMRYAQAHERLLDARNRVAALSKREREVLDWLSQGLSNKAIARELGISPRTVEIHRANMMAKLGASHAADAVRMQIEANSDMRMPT